MKPLQRLKSIVAYFSERLPVEKFTFESMFARKEVPVHRMGWAYYLGGLALFFFMIQVVTGLMLLFYYEPTVTEANASIDFVTNQVAGGALIRNIHAWSSSFMIFCVMVHLLTVFAMKAFEKPRELTWWSGVFLLFVTFAFGFTGYLLPWNQIAVNATKVGLQSIEMVGTYLPRQAAHWPVKLREIIQGGPTVGQATLSRFFAAHVVVLPMLIILLLGLHLFSVQLHGMNAGTDRPTGKTEKFFPFYALKDFSIWGIAFLILFALGLCFPFDSLSPYPLFQPFDPLGSTPDGIKPEWYFYFLYYPLELLPFWVIGLGMLAIVTGLILTPFIFSHTRRRTLKIIAAAAALYLVIMTVFGHQIYTLVKGGK